jgi:hypothetical protein
VSVSSELLSGGVINRTVQAGSCHAFIQLSLFGLPCEARNDFRERHNHQARPVFETRNAYFPNELRRVRQRAFSLLSRRDGENDELARSARSDYQLGDYRSRGDAVDFVIVAVHHELLLFARC